MKSKLYEMRVFVIGVVHEAAPNNFWLFYYTWHKYETTFSTMTLNAIKILITMKKIL